MVVGGEVFRHATNEPKLSQITDFRAFHAAKVRHGGTEKQASVALKDLEISSSNAMSGRARGFQAWPGLSRDSR